jgi:hypothetical protein
MDLAEPVALPNLANHARRSLLSHHFVQAPKMTDFPQSLKRSLPGSPVSRWCSVRAVWGGVGENQGRDGSGASGDRRRRPLHGTKWSPPDMVRNQAASTTAWHKMVSTGHGSQSGSVDHCMAQNGLHRTWFAIRQRPSVPSPGWQEPQRGYGARRPQPSPACSRLSSRGIRQATRPLTYPLVECARQAAR